MLETADSRAVKTYLKASNPGLITSADCKNYRLNYQ